MRKLLLLLVLASHSLFAQLRVSPELEAYLQPASKQHQATIALQLSFDAQYKFDSLNVEITQARLSRDARIRLVLREGMQFAAQHQEVVLSQLKEWESAGLVSHIYASWTTNTLFFEMSTRLLPSLILLDPPAELSREVRLPMQVPPYTSAPAALAVGGAEPGLQLINAPFMWNLGYTGYGRLAYVFDTGIMSMHPALRQQFLGNRFGLACSWFSGLGASLPHDHWPSDHGTHVSGTILGLDRKTNDTIGVAPNSYFIANDIIGWTGSSLTTVQGFEIAFNPDGDTSTTHDVPHVINNSWSYGTSRDSFRCTTEASLWAALEAAGIANIFANGNEGPNIGSVSAPAAVAIDSLRNFAVGAVTWNSLHVAGFSGRGPSFCASDSLLAIKPQVSAPGVNIRSARGREGYASASGTSMASPHVAGAYLLLSEAFPYASVREILNAMFQSATDLGPVGYDNTYGRGLINLEAAFLWLSQSYTPSPPNNSLRDLAIIGVDVSDGDLFCNSGLIDTVWCNIQNMGTDTVQGFVLQQDAVGATPQLIPFGGSLLPGMDTLIPVVLTGPFQGDYPEIKLKVSTTGAPERDTVNNYYAFRVRYQSGNGTFGNLSSGRHQNFMNESLFNRHWIINDLDDDGLTWERVAISGLQPTTFAVVLNHSSYAPRLGQLDELQSPFFTAAGAGQSTSLHFRMAYRHRLNFTGDTLTIFTSQDCEHWTEVFRTGGSAMVTYAGGNIPADAADWQTITLPDIIPVGVKTTVKFVTRNGFGGNLFITNVSYGDEAIGMAEFPIPAFNLYPNPATEEVVVEVASAVPQQLQIHDQAGRLVLHQLLEPGSNRHTIQTSQLAAGFYLVAVSSTGGIAVKKLMVMKP